MAVGAVADEGVQDGGAGGWLRRVVRKWVYWNLKVS